MLDRNGNGKVDDGTERSAPAAPVFELAAYDDDGNRWVDANDDSIPNVWVQTADGRRTRSLAEVVLLHCMWTAPRTGSP